MKSKTTYYLIFILVLCSWTTSQTINFSFKEGIQQVVLDNLQNTYVVKKDNSIVKIDKNGIEKAHANFKSFGELTHLDATNPFMVYAFYQNQNVLVITDNFLNIRSTIKLDQLESNFITILSRSVNDGIWVFDLNDYQLKKYDQNLSLQQTSGNVMTWLEKEPDFNYMIAEGAYVYLNSPSTGILVFDQFANYYKTIPIKGLSELQVRKEQIFYQRDSTYLRYQPKFLKTDTLVVVKDNIKVQKQNDITIMYEGNNLSINR